MQVSDLGALVRDTHKFESRYLDGLVAPYATSKHVFDARSPLVHVNNLKKPMIIFQGTVLSISFTCRAMHIRHVQLR